MLSRLFLFQTLLYLLFCIHKAEQGSKDESYIASKSKADKMERLRCGYNLMRLWTTEVAHSPFAAAPLITDVDADGEIDIVAAALNDAQTVVQGETGSTLPNSHWPTQKLDSSILASPLQYDINRDGLLDLLFVTSSAELLFYSPNGTAIRDTLTEIPAVYVKRNWYRTVPSVSYNDVGNFIMATDRHSQQQALEQGYLPVDPHVLATPVIADLNNDDQLEELVIPVSYYFDEEDYRMPENLDELPSMNRTELDNYVVSGVVIVNLTSLEVMRTVYLDLTTKNSAFPAYMLFSPTVIDIDRGGGELEIVVANSAGNIYVLDHHGQHRAGFPYSMTSIHGQVTVADLNKDGTLELIAVDTSGNVICLNEDGTLYWEAKVSGSSSPGSRLVDVDGDKYLDVVITTNEGDVYALRGIDGSILPGWPVQTGHSILSNVVATQMSSTRTGLDLVFLSGDGSLHVMSLDQKCKTKYELGETSLVQILSYDLVDQSEGLELLIATNDGTLICMGSSIETESKFLDEEKHKKQLLTSLPAETRSPNDFTFTTDQMGVFIHTISRTQPEITGGKFLIHFSILDDSFRPVAQRTPEYTIKVYFGSRFLYKAQHAEPGLHSAEVQAWNRPSHGHVTVILTNQKGQIFKDVFTLRFYETILQDLQWLLMAPFIAMVSILLVNHGFPAKDLLPYTLRSKTR